MALATVNEYIAEARRLLQDVRAPYRFPDADYVAALNNGLMEARRLRPDLFIGVTTVPTHVAGSGAVAFDVQYRTALADYIVANVQIADDEVEQDARSVVFTQKFVSKLLALGA